MPVVIGLDSTVWWPWHSHMCCTAILTRTSWSSVLCAQWLTGGGAGGGAGGGGGGVAGAGGVLRAGDEGTAGAASGAAGDDVRGGAGTGEPPVLPEAQPASRAA